MLLRDVERGHSTTLTCKACVQSGVTELHQCAACKGKKTTAAFDQHVLENSRKHKRLLVCKACQGEGYSPRDCTQYSCDNGCTRGHLGFNGKQLENHKGRGGQLRCLKCMQTAQDRVARLVKTLRLPDSWKCTCKKIAAGGRAYAALHNNMGHAEKCLLFPRHFGERRWDGRNNGVTQEDLQFLVAEKSKW
jgi:hypothetical protein